MYQATLFLHLAAAIIWMGGMTCLLFAVRPATLAVMEAKPRALLMAEVWQRFFNIVLACVVVLFASGTSLYTTGFRAAKAATGSGSVALGWNLMLVLGLVMFLIFGHIYFAGLKKFKRAVQAGEFPLAAQAAARIHTMVVANFVLGWVAIVCVRLLR
jgi:uncharacterized membrane protein